MKSKEIFYAFIDLGRKLETVNENHPVIQKTYHENNWFTPQNQLNAIRYWSSKLNHKELEYFYEHCRPAQNPVNVGLITAGNIPLVGFHDILCILLSGHKLSLKLSTNDSVLSKWILELLFETEPKFKDSVRIVDKLQDHQAVIATGSNNTSRYFEHYFRNLPRIIRKNRNSLAVLTGNETETDLLNLSNDIFSYFGLGCRNVSKIMVPEGYDFHNFFQGLERHAEVANHHKYHNNYIYHKAIFLMNLEKHFDNGFLLLKEDAKLASPLATLFFQYYNRKEEVSEFVEQNLENIQIVIGKSEFSDEFTPFGQSQNPELYDFADKVNTLEFLNGL
ncbi:MAG: acyl-CoA reductase [Flavobacteriales bacterium]|nr:acyl-CoA reductase [Flavobacteriales bacterium]